MRYAPPPTDDRVLWDTWLSVHRLQVLSVAYEVGLFEALAAGPLTAAALAEQRGYNRRGTDVVLSMLAALELVRATPVGFELTTVARTYLVASSPFDWGPLLRSILGTVPQMHQDLVRVLTGPETLSAPAQGWVAGQMSPELATLVTRVMHCHSLAAAISFARLPEVASVRRMLDVGGGSGVFSIAFAQHHHEARATVMELAAVCEVARSYIADGEVADRVDARAVDMFRDAWPDGYDAVLLSNVFHDWGVETNTQLARSAFSSLTPGGRILLHEMLVEEQGGSPTVAGFSVRMLTSTQGKQYSLAELREILEAAGFRDVRATPSHVHHSIVSATKP